MALLTLPSASASAARQVAPAPHVRSIATSAFTPPCPAPSGLAYQPAADEL